MKLSDVETALKAIEAGTRTADLESEVLDFKRDPSTVTGPHAPGNPRARLVEVLIDAVVCFANGRGGTVVLGVDDKLSGPEAIIGTAEDIDFIRRRIFDKTHPSFTLSVREHHHSGTRLIVIEVPEGLDLVTDTKGRALQRRGTDCLPMAEDARRALSFARRNPDLTARASERSPDDIDPAALFQVRSLLRGLLDARSQMADLSDQQLLRALNLVDRDGTLLTAGEILLCRPEHDTVDLLTRSSAGAEPSVRRYREPLIMSLPQVLTVLRSALNPELGHLSLANGQEIALPDFSPIAVDEAVTNALVHRDWGTHDRVVIDHAPQVLRVWSPGSLPIGVSADRLLSTVSTPRNPALMGALQQLGLAERASRGIDRMFREQIRVGQQMPRIRANEFSVEVFFTGGAPNRAFAGFVASLPERLRTDVDALLVLDHLCRRPALPLDEAAQLFQVSVEEAENVLSALAVGPDAIIEKEHARKKGQRWRLRQQVAAGLGTAVVHRTRADSARPRVETHLAEYGWITNRTLRNMFDLDVQQSTQMLDDLRTAGVIVKDPDGPQRGPNIKWLPATTTKRKRT